MADLEGVKVAKDYHVDVPFANNEGFYVKGANHLDWGMKKHLSNIFSSKSGNTVMFAFDHGYFMGSTAGLERLDLVIPKLVPYVDVLMGKAYQSWQSEQFFRFMERFGIDCNKKIKDYSKGMRMKVSIAAALSHGAELLIMDEPTSGLDPVVRDEVLDLFYDFMQEDSHAILLSSHITSDLDKIADHITFIHQGRVLLSEPRDELLDTFGVLRCTAEQLSALEPSAMRAKRIGAFGCEALVRRDSVPANWPVEAANIEQIMLFLTRGEEQR